MVAGYTLLYSLSYAGLFCTRNIRNEAGEWINSNIPEKSKIGLTQMPAPYRTPPFAFYRYNLMPVGWEKQIMGKEKPEYFVLSEYDTRYIKEGYQNTFFQDYELMRKFEKQPEILGIKFKKGRFSAKDWWEPNPVIWIYKRKYVER